jgi:hypothetical protein
MSKQEYKIIAVNNPGGQPRQFCVQLRSGVDQNWQREAVFRDRESATRCCQELQRQGLQTRLVHYRLPTAA